MTLTLCRFSRTFCGHGCPDLNQEHECCFDDGSYENIQDSSPVMILCTKFLLLCNANSLLQMFTLTSLCAAVRKCGIQQEGLFFSNSFLHKHRWIVATPSLKCRDSSLMERVGSSVTACLILLMTCGVSLGGQPPLGLSLAELFPVRKHAIHR